MKARASLKNGSPVFLLGHCYHPQTDGECYNIVSSYIYYFISIFLTKAACC